MMKGPSLASRASGYRVRSLLLSLLLLLNFGALMLLWCDRKDIRPVKKPFLRDLALKVLLACDH